MEKHCKKHIIDFEVVDNQLLHHQYSLLRLRPAAGGALPDTILPGQFAEVAVDNSPATFLRRPISINNVDRERNELWLLVRRAGAGTSAIMARRVGERLNLVVPLGHGFTLPAKGERTLLVGGGVGVAPLYYLARTMVQQGLQPEVLIGARAEADLLLLDEFSRLGPVHVSTDDGSAGEPGVVTANSSLAKQWSRICCCGPLPMMKAVARVARQMGAQCEVSLENMMACGLGACLCCVEPTVGGNVCVCTEGPVFNIDQLTWND